MQALANRVLLSEKEPHFAFLDPFFSQNKDKMSIFLDKISTPVTTPETMIEVETATTEEEVMNASRNIYMYLIGCVEDVRKKHTSQSVKKETNKQT